MKVILLRDNDKPPIKLNINKWWFIAPMLFSLAAIIALPQLGFDFNIIKKFSLLKTEQVIAGDVETVIKNDMLESHVPSLYLSEKQASTHAGNLAQGGISGEAFEPKSEEVVVGFLLETIRQSQKNLTENQLEQDLLQASIDYNEFLLNPVKVPVEPEFFSPVRVGYISSNYGMRRDPINGKHRFHKGIDIAGREGTPVDTIASGFVTFAGKKGGYGNVVEIHHSDTLKSRYAHLNKIFVKKGMVIRKGEKIATMGSTGRVTGPHLHLEVWKNRKAVNPKKYLKLALSAMASK